VAQNSHNVFEDLVLWTNAPTKLLYATYITRRRQATVAIHWSDITLCHFLSLCRRASSARFIGSAI